MIKETEPLHPMLHSLKLKDLLEMQLKIKLPRIPTTLSLMPRDLLEENSQIQSSKKIANYGHSKLKLDPMTNQLSLSSTRTKPKSSILNKFHRWFLLRWRKLPRHLSDSPLKTQLSLSQPISTITKGKQPRMLEALLALTFWESLTSQLPLLSLTD